MPELRVLIVYASQSGHAQSLADALERGARAEGAEVRKLHGTLAGIDDLLWCRALAIVTPENFGYMAGAVAEPILWVGESEAPLAACSELGQTLAAGLELGIF